MSEEKISIQKLSAEKLSPFGPNFPMLGIVEFPKESLNSRFSISKTHELPLNLWTDVTPLTYAHLWTDGSCDFNQYYLHTLGAFSVIAEGGRVLNKGPVHHISLNPYACELWAVVCAASQALQPVIIHSDCLSIVNQFQSLMELDSVPFSWSHWHWWNHLLIILQMRRSHIKKPVLLQWCPAHILEELPCELISDALAAEHGTNTSDIYHNRIADKVAKQALDSQKFSHHKKWVDLQADILIHQKWLAYLHVFLSELPQPCKTQRESPCENVSIVPHTLTVNDEINKFKEVLPRWNWHPVPSDFTWNTSFSFAPLKSSAAIHPDDWSTAISFFQKLKWCIAEDLQTSFMELAYEFWQSNLRFKHVDETPASYSTLLRKVISQANRLCPDHHIVPGAVHAVSKSNGKTHPSGLIQGASPLLAAESLRALALPMLSGRKHPLKLWTSF